MNQVEYEYKSVTDIGDRQYRLIDYKEEGGAKYKDLIHIYDGKLNNIGDKTTALSKSWYIKADKKEVMKELKNNTENYYITGNIFENKPSLDVSIMKDKTQITVVNNEKLYKFLSIVNHKVNSKKEQETQEVS